MDANDGIDGMIDMKKKRGYMTADEVIKKCFN